MNFIKKKVIRQLNFKKLQLNTSTYHVIFKKTYHVGAFEPNSWLFVCQNCLAVYWN